MRALELQDAAFDQRLDHLKHDQIGGRRRGLARLKFAAGFQEFVRKRPAANFLDLGAGRPVVRPRAGVERSE